MAAVNGKHERSNHDWQIIAGIAKYFSSIVVIAGYFCKGKDRSKGQTVEVVLMEDEVGARAALSSFTSRL